jgi:hypothetical protein
MGLDAQSADPSSPTLASDKGRPSTDKKGKMRKTDPSSTPDDVPVPEKKPRKKWTQEETMMLVNGCQIVRFISFLFVILKLTFDHNSMVSETGKRSYRTLISSFKIVRPSISKTGTWQSVYSASQTPCSLHAS